MAELTALVVGLNEGHQLEKCLTALHFCKKIIYLDMGSSDGSVEVANSIPNVEVQIIDRVPAVEQVHSEMKKYTQSEWVLIIDPDEVVDKVLADQIVETFKEVKSNHQIGSVEVPEIYYFKQKPLTGGVWGGIKFRTLIVHQDRFIFTPNVHVGRSLRPGYTSYRLAHFGSNVVHHYWANSIIKLIKKQKRYLELEGFVRFTNGQRIAQVEIKGVPINEFRAAFFTLGGKNDGPAGLILALLWAWYQFEASKALFRQQELSGIKNFPYSK